MPTLAPVALAPVVSAPSGPTALDLLEATERSSRSLDAMRIRALAQAPREWEGEPAAALHDMNGLAWRCLRADVAQVMAVSESRAHVLLESAATLVARLPATMSAVEAGRLDLDRAVAVARPLRTLPDDLIPEYEACILPVAQVSPAGRRLERIAEQTAQQLHPEGFAERVRRGHETRHVLLEPAGEGMAYLGAVIPAVQAVAAHAGIDGHARALRAAGDARTLDQIRADVFVDLLTDPGAVLPPLEAGGTSRQTNAGRRGITAEVVVHIPAASIDAADRGAQPAEAGWLDGFGPLDPAAAISAVGLGRTLRRALIDPVTGTVREADATRYRIPEHLRFAAELRDRTCRSPGCHRPAASCDLDHQVPWEEHGPTVLSNLESLCRNHHLLKHTGDWTPAGDPNGTLTWTGPSGRTYAAPLPPPRIMPRPGRPVAEARPDRVRFRDVWCADADGADDSPF